MNTNTNTALVRPSLKQSSCSHLCHRRRLLCQVVNKRMRLTSKFSWSFQFCNRATKKDSSFVYLYAGHRTSASDKTWTLHAHGPRPMDSRAPGFPTRFRKANRSDLVHAASGEIGIDAKTHQWVHPLERWKRNY